MTNMYQNCSYSFIWIKINNFIYSILFFFISARRFIIPAGRAGIDLGLSCGGGGGGAATVTGVAADAVLATASEAHATVFLLGGGGGGGGGVFIGASIGVTGSTFSTIPDFAVIDEPESDGAVNKPASFPLDVAVRLRLLVEVTLNDLREILLAVLLILDVDSIGAAVAASALSFSSIRSLTIIG
jgi:hypothetical protein